MKPRIRMVLTLVIVALITVVAIVAGYSLLFSPEEPTPTDPPTAPSTDPPAPTNPSVPTEALIDFSIRGYLFSGDRQYLDSASFTAKGPSLNELGSSDAAPFDWVEVDGFPDIVEADGCKARMKEHKNGVLEIIIEKMTQRRDYETGELNAIFTEVRYSIFIDGENSEFLMCIIYPEDSNHTFYFTTSEHPRSISDVFTRAYMD